MNWHRREGRTTPPRGSPWLQHSLDNRESDQQGHLLLATLALAKGPRWRALGCIRPWSSAAISASTRGPVDSCTWIKEAGGSQRRPATSPRLLRGTDP